MNLLEAIKTGSMFRVGDKRFRVNGNVIEQSDGFNWKPAFVDVMMLTCETFKLERESCWLGNGLVYRFNDKGVVVTNLIDGSPAKTDHTCALVELTGYPAPSSDYWMELLRAEGFEITPDRGLKLYTFYDAVRGMYANCWKQGFDGIKYKIEGGTLCDASDLETVIPTKEMILSKTWRPA